MHPSEATFRELIFSDTESRDLFEQLLKLDSLLEEAQGKGFALTPMPVPGMMFDPTVNHTLRKYEMLLSQLAGLAEQRDGESASEHGEWLSYNTKKIRLILKESQSSGCLGTTFFLIGGIVFGLFLFRF